MTSLNIATINVNGLSNQTKRLAYIEFLVRHDLDIIFLVETKCSNKNHKNLRDEWIERNKGEAKIFATPAKPSPTQRGGTHGGTAILLRGKAAKARVFAKKIIQNHDALSINVAIDKNRFKIIALYCPNDANKRAEFLKKVFLSEADADDCQIIYGGDFNFVPNIDLDKHYKNPTERRKGRDTRGKEEVDNYNAIHSCVDAFRYKHPNVPGFTYTHNNHSDIPNDDLLVDSDQDQDEDLPILVSNSQETDRNPTRSRIDRIYISEPINQNYTCSIVEPPKILNPSQGKVNRSTDHNALILKNVQFKGIVKERRGPGLWKLNCELLQCQDYVDGIQDIYSEIFGASENSERSILENWDIFKAKVQQFSIFAAVDKKRQRDYEILIAEEKLKRAQTKVQTLTPEQQARYEAEMDRYRSVLALEETRQFEALRIKNKLDNLEGDEKGTKYFATRLKKRNTNRHITEIKDENSLLRTNQTEVTETIHKFYKNLFSNDEDISTESQETLLANIEVKLSTANRDELEKPLIRQELYSAIRKLPKDKTPGIDGLPKEFYHKFDYLITDKLTEVANYIQQNETKARSHTLSYIALLYKKGERQDLKNWRPLSMINCDWKIVTKAHANRLKCILNTIIQPDQTAGIPGRSIRDNQWATRDILEYGYQTNTPGAIVALDAEKAFDRVNHPFLIKVLEKLGFGPNFVKMVKTILTNNKTMALNNGYLSSEIPIQRGTRQGCPISAYLYVIVAETLAIAIRKEVSVVGYPRPPGSTGKTKVSLYADDTINYLDAKPTTLKRSLIALSRILAIYQSASGSKINDSKTEIIHFGSKDPNRAATNTRAFLVDSDLPIKYWTVKSIDLGFRSLGITYKRSLAKTHEANYAKCALALKDKIAFLSLRQLSIKGRSMALKTQALSLLWSTAAVVPLSSSGSLAGEGLGISNEKLKEIAGLANKYIWSSLGASPTTLAQTTLQKPYQQGGLNTFDIGIQAESLLMSQLTGILDPSNNRSSVVYARFWFAKNKDFYGLEVNDNPDLSFLNKYNHNVKTHPNLAIQAMGLFFQKNSLNKTKTKLYTTDMRPTNKQIYKTIKLTNPDPDMKCHSKWNKAIIAETGCFVTRKVVPMAGSWHSKTPCTNYAFQYLWRARHFCLVLNEKIHTEKEKRGKDDNWYKKCHTCHPDKPAPATEEPPESLELYLDKLKDKQEILDAAQQSVEANTRPVGGVTAPLPNILAVRRNKGNVTSDQRQKETHIHTLANCKKVIPLWTKVRQLLKQVCDPPKHFTNQIEPDPFCQPHPPQTVPEKNFYLITGVNVRMSKLYPDKPMLGYFPDKSSIHLNAIVALTLREIWKDRNLVVFENKKDRTPDSIYRTVRAMYKRWLQDQYDILLRRGDIPFRLNSSLTPRQQFVKYYQINNICIARETETKLIFRI